MKHKISKTHFNPSELEYFANADDSDFGQSRRIKQTKVNAHNRDYEMARLNKCCDEKSQR